MGGAMGGWRTRWVADRPLGTPHSEGRLAAAPDAPDREVQRCDGAAAANAAAAAAAIAAAATLPFHLATTERQLSRHHCLLGWQGTLVQCASTVSNT